MPRTGVHQEKRTGVGGMDGEITALKVISAAHTHMITDTRKDDGAFRVS